MLKSYLKKKLGIGEKEIPESQQFYSPLRIGLHSTIDIKTVDWIIIQESLNKAMVLPKGRLSVDAIGKVTIDNDEIFNIYLSDQNGESFTLQLYCAEPDKGDRIVNEATLYKQVVNIIPMTEAEWEVNLDGIGHNVLDLDDREYKRVWLAESNGKVDLLDFEERIVRHSKIHHYNNHYMLYSREVESMVGTNENEFLLVGVEETDESAEITMMIGLPVPLSNINVQ